MRNLLGLVAEVQVWPHLRKPGAEGALPTPDCAEKKTKKNFHSNFFPDNTVTFKASQGCITGQRLKWPQHLKQWKTETGTNPFLSHISSPPPPTPLHGLKTTTHQVTHQSVVEVWALRLEVTTEVVDPSEAGIALRTLVGLGLLSAARRAGTFTLHVSPTRQAIPFISWLTLTRHAIPFTSWLTPAWHVIVVTSELTPNGHAMFTSHLPPTRHTVTVFTSKLPPVWQAVTLITQLTPTQHAIMFTAQLCATRHAIMFATHRAGKSVCPTVHCTMTVTTSAGQVIWVPFSCGITVSTGTQPIQSSVSHWVHVTARVWESIQPTVPCGVSIATNAGGGVHVANVCGAVLTAAVHLALGWVWVPRGQQDALVKVLCAGIHQLWFALTLRLLWLHLLKQLAFHQKVSFKTDNWLNFEVLYIYPKWKKRRKTNQLSLPIRIGLPWGLWGGKDKATRKTMNKTVQTNWQNKLETCIQYWAIQAVLLTPLTFALHHLSPLAAFTSGAYFLHNGRRWHWQWIWEFYTANFKGILEARSHNVSGNKQ